MTETQEPKDNSDKWVGLGAPSNKVLTSPEGNAMGDAAPGKMRLRIAKQFLKAEDKELKALACYYTASAYSEIAESAWFPTKWTRLAKRCYRKSLDLLPFWGSATLNLSVLLIAAREYQETIRVVHESITLGKQEIADGKRLGNYGARTFGWLYNNLLIAKHRQYSSYVDRTTQWRHIQGSKAEVACLEDIIGILENITDPIVVAKCLSFRAWRARSLAFIAASTQEYDAWVKRGCVDRTWRMYE